MKKRLISVLLVLVMIFAFIPLVYAEENFNSKLYTIYADDMLFKHSEETILAGTGKTGDTITAELYKGKKLIISGESTVGDDGKFTVSFMAPKGSYTQYMIMLKENGTVFRILNNVVFGELWLASGQSNMMYPLYQSRTGVEMWQQGQKLSPYLRVLLVPGYPAYKDQTALTLLPLEKQDDIIDAKWVTGENMAVYEISAVAYFFAEAMMKELDMPVGILNSSLGGSSIASWLSRETCESDTALTNYLRENGQYVPASEWKEDEQDVYTSVTANYNQKIHPLKHFRPTGLIWYQGETDVFWSDEMYSRAFNLMQDSYSKLFGFGNEKMPFIYTQLAPYNYGDDMALPQRNYFFTQMQQQDSSSRAVISIHDIPLTYFMPAGVIHPACKEEVGQRMFFAAEGLVYSERDTYTVATIKNTEIKDSGIYVTFDNIGDGIKADEDIIRGFAICDKTGIYVQADAEIISADTVRIYSENVKEPVSASYAFCPSNMRANLYATENGQIALPLGPFVTDRNYMQRVWKDIPWADCDNEQTWFNNSDPYSAFYDSWTSENAVLSYSENALNVLGENEFSISPTLYYTADGKKNFHNDAQRDLTPYSAITFYARNNGDKDVKMSKVQLYKDTVSWYSPEVNSLHDSGFIIPADGEWHKITLDLNALYHFGNECGIKSPNNMIPYLQEMNICFESEGKADITVDNFRFVAETEDTGFICDADIKDADNIWEKICALFVMFLGIFF